jgi:branched-chain amino acid transport system ATP-binding protein
MSNPRLLLLDEVSLGLAPIAVADVYRSLQTVIEGGTTVLLVEQELTRALDVAQRVLCMLEGRIVLEGSAGELTREQIADAYFGLRRNGGGTAPA